MKEPKIVYVLDVDGNPLMPTTRNGWVRRALRDGKAIVVHTLPFTIQLTYITATNVVQYQGQSSQTLVTFIGLLQALLEQG